MKFAKIVFLVAGIYGLIVLLPAYFLEERRGRHKKVRQFGATCTLFLALRDRVPV